MPCGRLRIETCNSPMGLGVNAMVLAVDSTPTLVLSISALTMCMSSNLAEWTHLTHFLGSLARMSVKGSVPLQSICSTSIS